MTVRALRRERTGSDQQFPRDVLELQAWFGDPEPDQAVRAVPGAGLQVPIWLLGSSLFSAQLAAHLGLPYAFASHFAPALLADALHVYRSPSSHRSSWRSRTRWSGQRRRRRQRRGGTAAVHLAAGAVDRHDAGPARTSWGLPSTTSRPCWTGLEKPAVEEKLSCSVVGDPDAVGSGDQGYYRTDRGGRADHHLPHLRSGGMPPVSRDPGLGAGRRGFNRQLRRKPWMH